MNNNPKIGIAIVFIFLFGVVVSMEISTPEKKYEVPKCNYNQRTLPIQSNDTDMATVLRDAKLAHIQWVKGIKSNLDSRNRNLPEELMIEPTKCAFHIWLNSSTIEQLICENKDLKALYVSIELKHKELHHNIKPINNMLLAGNFAQANNYYTNNLLPNLELIHTYLNNLIEWHAENEHQASAMAN